DRTDELANAEATHRRRRRISVHPYVRHYRLDRDRADYRQYGSGDHGHTILAGERGVGGDGPLLPHLAAHAAYEHGQEDHGREPDRAGRPGDAEEGTLSGLRDCQYSGLYSAGVLLRVYERIFE